MQIDVRSLSLVITIPERMSTAPDNIRLGVSLSVH